MTVIDEALSTLKALKRSNNNPGAVQKVAALLSNDGERKMMIRDDSVFRELTELLVSPERIDPTGGHALIAEILRHSDVRQKLARRDSQQPMNAAICALGGDEYGHRPNPAALAELFDYPEIKPMLLKRAACDPAVADDILKFEYQIDKTLAMAERPKSAADDAAARVLVILAYHGVVDRMSDPELTTRIWNVVESTSNNSVTRDDLSQRAPMTSAAGVRRVQ